MINYLYTTSIHNLRAPREVIPILLEYFRPKSVLDIGCGTGTWLKVFEELDISDYMGIDGSAVSLEQLHIPKEKFKIADLSKPIDLGRRFDLVVCLEVAEHLSDLFADTLVNTLVKHADTILFSAAIPGQGGQDHVNEQWPSYWKEKFASHGYYFHDVIRPRIWTNKNVDSWYKQNIFLVNRVKNDASMLSIVHPEVFTAIVRNRMEYEQSLTSGKQGLKLSAKIFFQAVLYKLSNLMSSR
jgi:SAM-dependent methyltransferase